MGAAIEVQAISQRMEALGLGFMSAGLESFLSEQSHTELPLTEVIARLIELEYLPRKERAARTRLKLRPRACPR
jgi:hypothetical protein